jgi:16S rRNA processing protein RimM
MKQSECYLLGKVQKLYSYKGAVWLYLDVDNPAEYAEMDSLFIEQNGQLVPYFIENISLKTNQALVKFEGIDTQEAAQNLLSCPLYLPLEVLPDLDEDNFYLHEVVGFDVIDTKKGLLGKIANIYTMSHTNLIAMEYQEKEVLIPIQDDIVGKADKVKKTLQVNLPDGLLETYLEE